MADIRFGLAPIAPEIGPGEAGGGAQRGAVAALAPRDDHRGAVRSPVGVDENVVIVEPAVGEQFRSRQPVVVGMHDEQG